ncbi:hypothetical protein PPAR_b0587 [Pseudoalteromonas paragorgicola KMM 3548]|nr:hypothetical protein [Pseudoalteromonas distincta KMM 3548]
MYLESLDNLGEPFQFHHTLRHHVFSFQAQLLEAFFIRC